ncbi:MAG TPA: cytochrome c biogenesis protein ResB, partial [Blastocatellia bacterium]
MATIEPEIKAEASASPATEAKVLSKKKDVSILDKFLGLLSSVRFGIVMLMILLACCMIGMLIMQKDVDGFLEYYNRLTPAQRTIWGKLGFFDIYHSWYFGLLLAITGLNIILASIDRFPTAWQYV